MRFRETALVLFLSGSGALVRAEEPVRAPAFGERSLHLLQLMVLDMTPAEPKAPAPGSLGWSLKVAFATTYQHTWQVTVVHADRGRTGLPLDAGLAEDLHERFAGDRIVFVDGEVTRTSLAARYGVSRTLSFRLEVPYLSRDLVSSDPFVAGFHEATGLPNAGRDAVPRGRMAVLLQAPSGPISFHEGVTRSGVGDIVLTTSWRPSPNASGGLFGADASIKAPTGAPEQFNGSGSWDVGLLTYARWSAGAWSLHAELAGTLPGPMRAPIAVETKPFLRAAFGLIRPLSARWRVGAGLGASSHVFTIDAGDGPGVDINLGAEHELLPGTWVRATVVEDSPSGRAERADIALSLSLRVETGGGYSLK